jgi:hypothetical protein
LLLREWAARTFPGVKVQEQFRLGPTTLHLVGVTVTPAFEAALRVNNWFADAIMMLPSETMIVEAKVRPTPSAVSQVQFYADLLPTTPEMQTRLGLPIRCVLLFAEDDPRVTNFARRHGCAVYIYTPSWIQDYLANVQYKNLPGRPVERSPDSETDGTTSNE